MKTVKVADYTKTISMRKTIRKMLALILIIAMLLGAVPAQAVDYEPPIPPSDSFQAVEAVMTVTEGKYFRLSEHPVIRPLSEGTLGLGTFGTLYAHVIPDGRLFAFEFVVEQSQEIRLELHEALPGDPPQAGEKLGLLAVGYCEGQWGNLADAQTGEKPGLQWFEPPDNGEEITVANRFVWDGRCWDEATGRYFYPGDADAAYGDFIVRFRPTDPDVSQWVTDLPIRVSRTEEAVASGMQHRGMPVYGDEPVDMVSDPVHMPSGNFIWDYTDIAVHGAKPLEFARFYNAMSAEDGELGHGWSHNFSHKVEAGGLFATIHMADGITVSYARNRDGTFERSQGNPHQLELTAGGGYVYTMLDMTRFEFNEGGLLTSVMDVNGSETTVERNGEQILAVANASGSLSFSYTGERITSITDHAGRSINYAYSQSGDLLSFTNADGNTIRYAYDTHHRITEITDFNGNIYLTNEYDELGRVIAQHIVGQGTSWFEYDYATRESAWTDPHGVTTTYRYDTTGRITSVTDAAGTSSYEYDGGRLTRSIDRLGNATTYRYDTQGKRISITFADGTSEQYERNAMNLVTKYTARDGSVTRYAYDTSGNLTSTTDSRGNTVTFVHDENGNMTSMSDAIGNETAYERDEKGNVLSTTDPLGNTTFYEYDTQGRLVRQENADESYLEYAYTPAGKLVSITDAMGNVQTYDVDGNGYVIGYVDHMGSAVSAMRDAQNRTINETDAMGNVTAYSYDANGNMTARVDALGGTVTYVYDVSGCMTSIIDAMGGTWTYSYDAEGRMVSVTDPMGSMALAEYDGMGRVLSTTDALGAATTYTYDAMGRVVAESDALGNVKVYEYDAAGNMTARVDVGGNRWELAYDANNRIISETDPQGNVTAYERDANGRIIATVTPLGARVTTEYDCMGRPSGATDAEGNITAFRYDHLGRLTETEHPDGTMTLYAYDANGRLTSAVTPGEIEVWYSYDANGNVTEITDALGETVTYSYDALGRAVSMTDPMGGTTRYTYDAAMNMTGVIDALGNSTSYSYDSLGRATSITDPLGNITTIEYDAVGNVARVTNPDGGMLTYNYDPLGRLIGYVDAEGYGFSFRYDAYGNITSMTDGNGNATIYGYDALGRATSITNATGGTTSVSYDAGGRAVAVTDAMGYTTTYGYDLDGRLTSIADTLGNSTMIKYDAMGRVASTTDARGAETRYSYTQSGKVSSVSNAIGSVTSYEYDAVGRLIAETDPMGNTTLFAYDPLGRVVSVADPLGNRAMFAYDAIGRIISSTDKNGNVTYFTYDANGNMTQTLDALGNASQYEYDAMRRLVRAVLRRVYAPRGLDEVQETSYLYDLRGFVTLETGALGNETSYEYDGNGNLVLKIDADGHETRYAFDARNLVEAISYSDGRDVLFMYDANGGLIAMEDWNGITSFALDALGRVVSANGHGGASVGYTYDAVGNNSSITYPDGTTALYSYDLIGRLTAIRDAEGQTVRYSYDAASRLTSMSYPNGWTESYEYDLASRLVRQLTADPSGVTNKAVERTYEYDAQGNVTAEYRSSGHGMESYTLSHAYDSLNRLTSTTGSQGYAERQYDYDSLGNLVRERVHNKWTEYWHNDLNQVTRKLMDGKDEYEYAFDGRGNLVQGIYQRNQNHSDIIETYEYDSTNRMVVGTNADGEHSHYMYDGLGNLIANYFLIDRNNYGYAGIDATPVYYGISPGPGQQAIHREYFINYASPLKEILMETESGTGGLAYRHVYGFGRISSVVTGVPNGAGSVMQYAYNDELGEFVLTGEDPGPRVSAGGIVKLWVHSGRLGTVDFLTDNVRGGVVGYASYDDWGTPTSKAVLRLGVRQLDLVTQYTVHGYDHVLGIYFAQARMYDAANRRFMAMDLFWNAYNRISRNAWLSNSPVPDSYAERQSANAYLYALNNPMKYVDYTGLDAILINKPVDNIANLIGVEHMSAFFQDSNETWFYFFWGDVVSYVEVDDDSIFQSIDNVNQWLISNSLLNPNHPYRDSVYIKGDFSLSNSEAQRLYNEYTESLSNWNERGLANRDYNVVLRNCGQVAVELAMMGTLPSGISVGTYLMNNAIEISMIPNIIMRDMQAVFYNDAINLSEFEADIESQRARYEGRNVFIQWWFSGLRRNIDAIS